jgi:hypothetical protein
MENGSWPARSILECGGLTPLSPTRRVASFRSADTSAHSKTWRYFVALTLLTLSTLNLQLSTAHAQQFSIDWYKIGGGGGTSTGATYQVSGTIGQPDAGSAMSGGSYSLTGGFWSIISVVQTPSLPDLTITFVGPNSVVVSWPNTGSYTLQQNNNLAGGSWGTSGYTITTNNGTNSITISPPTGNLFFRLSK